MPKPRAEIAYPSRTSARTLTLRQRAHLRSYGLVGFSTAACLVEEAPGVFAFWEPTERGWKKLRPKASHVGSLQLAVKAWREGMSWYQKKES